MKRWIAIVPFNYGGPRKTRLMGVMADDARAALAEQLARHVTGVLASTERIAAVHLLAPSDPQFADTSWIADHGRGLNGELVEAWRHAGQGAAMLIIHADLPLLAVDDVEALLNAAAERGAAIAPDAALQGTNALAVWAGDPFVPAFGANSFAAHRALLPQAETVTRPGLAVDIDDADSLAAARTLGWRGPLAPG